MATNNPINPINRVQTMADYDLLTGKQQVRVIVYELQNGSEDVFEIDSVEMEQHERAEADKHLHSRENLESSNPCVGYHFEYRAVSAVR